MSKYIKEHSLSPGYNLGGQEFFDIISMYENYIHSFFFSLTEGLNGEKYDRDGMVQTLSKCDQYDIPANLILNVRENSSNGDSWKDLLKMAFDCTNLKAVTVIDPETAIAVRELYPDLQLHASIRYFDWNQYDDSIEHLHKIAPYVEVINISGGKSYNDYALVEECRRLGLITKFIVNEGCIMHKVDGYQRFPGFENCTCYGENNKFCNGNCKRLCAKYNWMHLAKNILYKESLQYYDYDILKVSTRYVNNQIVINLMNYWTSDTPTETLNYFLPKKFMMEDAGNAFLNPDNYPIFLEWVKERSTCSGWCYDCRKCEDFYRRIKE